MFSLLVLSSSALGADFKQLNVEGLYLEAKHLLFFCISDVINPLFIFSNFNCLTSALRAYVNKTFFWGGGGSRDTSK